MDLDTVAIREREHAAAFTKRLSELGYGLRERNGARFEHDLALAASPSTDDATKFARLLPERAGSDRDRNDATDPLNHLFDDRSIDAQTGALLGRFIAEERDSERLLQAARKRVTEHAEGTGDELLEIAARIDRLTETLQSLKALRDKERAEQQTRRVRGDDTP